MNVPYVKTVKQGNNVIFVVVSHGDYDGFRGCYWRTYDVNGNTLSYGYSKGWRQTGLSSALLAMKNGKRSARRHLRRMENVHI